MNTIILSTVAQLSNHDLLARVKHLAGRERAVTATLVAHLAELDERRLYLAEGCASLFTYCTQILRLSEHAAYGRIEVARASRKYPVILELLSDGSVNLTTVCLLAPHLTPGNQREVLDLARHKTKRQVEELVARLRPQPSVPDTIRRLPIRASVAIHLSTLSTASQDAAPGYQPSEVQTRVDSERPAPEVAPAQARRAVITPLAPQQYKVQFTASAQLHEKLRQAQALLRHQIPDGDLSQIFDRALTALLQNLVKKKLAATDSPRASRWTADSSRHVPAAVRRAVWRRDEGRCAFVASNGRRCTEDSFVEFHHVVPYSTGGRATVENIQLRCRAHNGYEAARHLGRRTPTVVREPCAFYEHALGEAISVAAYGESSAGNSVRTELNPTWSCPDALLDTGVESNSPAEGKLVRTYHSQPTAQP